MGLTLGKETTKTGLGDLPESCVAMVLMHLDPEDVCRIAKLNRAFYRASSSDFIWESKLPSNYQQIIKKIFDDDFLVNLCMRDIYASLCHFNSVDGGTKKVWLDKGTGGICMAISTKGLSITGIDDRRYWNHLPTKESR